MELTKEDRHNIVADELCNVIAIGSFGAMPKYGVQYGLVRGAY
jgi:hypothetical protein